MVDSGAKDLSYSINSSQKIPSPSVVREMGKGSPVHQCIPFSSFLAFDSFLSRTLLKFFPVPPTISATDFSPSILISISQNESNPSRCFCPIHILAFAIFRGRKTPLRCLGTLDNVPYLSVPVLLIPIFVSLENERGSLDAWTYCSH